MQAAKKQQLMLPPRPSPAWKNQGQKVIGRRAEKLTTSDQCKDKWQQRKGREIHQAEMDKLAAQEQNAASRQAAATGGSTAYTATGGEAWVSVTPQGHTAPWRVIPILV
ncbi:hypothetical protein HAX54_031945 [Datura stramonium]|uniref:Uncharacterized protein n=1 Tax=Datura stramonium TaxID=4076 RepID=A0ABS8SCB9_DATST|nr:hypothetical protein [Datura stramonium]